MRSLRHASPSRTSRTALALLALLLVTGTGASAYDDSGWSPVFSTPPAPLGADDIVACSAEYNGAPVIGGFFTSIDGTTVNRIARWSGSAWVPLGTGMNGPVRALIVYNGSLVAAGDFTTAGGVAANRIARWTGSAWAPLGTGMGSAGTDVRALAVYGAYLVAGGAFAEAGGITASNVARWNGTSWSALGAGTDNAIYALEVFAGELIAGGYFGHAGAVPATCLARWTGSAWSAFPQQLDPGQMVSCLHVWNGSLLVGGVLGWIEGNPYSAGIVRWDGSSWYALGTGLTGGGGGGDASALATVGGDLIAGGNFDHAGGVPAANIARWDGAAWSPLGAGVSNPAYLDDDATYTILAFGAGFIAGGRFEGAGSAGTSNIARWTGADWMSMGTPALGGAGLSGPVYDFWSRDGHVQAGGNFHRAGGVLANCAGEWNDQAWRGYGLGLPAGDPYDHWVSAVTDFRGDPVAAFGRSVPGGFEDLIYRWSGADWQVIGTATSGSGSALTDLAVFNDELYVAGRFSAVDGVGGSKVVAWNGSDWHAVGSLPGNVNVLAVYAGKLYAAGASVFELSPDGAWIPLGTANGQVLGLAGYGDFLAAGGTFTSIGSASVNYLALWDGSTWTSPGGGTNAGVRAVTSHEGRLAVGGAFTQAGGVPANRIALWDGTAWSPLGSGVDAEVRTLLSLNSRLYVGGNFTTAGTVQSLYMARWDGLTPAAVPASSASGTARVFMQNPYRPGGSILLELPATAAMHAAIYDPQGRLVRRLVDCSSHSGHVAVSWDGRNVIGSSVPSGRYFLRAEAGDAQASRTFLLWR